ncbi:HAD hydrolase family protein [bacterium]|nr:HAD hydrolase family protein [bacterium]
MKMEEIKEIAKKIKLCAFDVDGVMTDCSLTFDENGVEYKTFNGKDGQGIQLLHKAGIIPAIITKRKNGTIRYRANVLGIKEFHEGAEDKLEELNKIVKKYNLSYSEIAYMGDDVPDVCVLEKVGLPCCPNDAVDEVKSVSRFISSKGGGRGAVRELTDLVLKSQGHDLTKLLYKPVDPDCRT